MYTITKTFFIFLDKDLYFHTCIYMYLYKWLFAVTHHIQLYGGTQITRCAPNNFLSKNG